MPHHAQPAGSQFVLNQERLVDIQDHLRAVVWMPPAETIQAAERAGEGNMNCTLRIRTDRRSFVLKQSRPWVEKYPHIPAPADRTLIEAQFYKLISEDPALARRMPRLTSVDESARMLMLEDLGEDSRDFTFVYKRSEERRVGKECSARVEVDHKNEKSMSH